MIKLHELKHCLQIMVINNTSVIKHSISKSKTRFLLPFLAGEVLMPFVKSVLLYWEALLI